VSSGFLANNNIIILLTGTINTYNKAFTLLNDPGKRKSVYINTIRYYLENYNYPIVFVENSHEDLSAYFINEIEIKRLEILCFNGNNYPEEIGKGLGEMRCIEFGINNSSLIQESSFIFKITGRYKILNMGSFINFYKKHPDVELIADLTNNFKSSQSCIFGFKPFFAKRFLFKYISIINDTNGVYFEHALAKAVLSAISENVNFHIFRHYPRIKAISGTTGKAYKRSFIYFFPRMLKYFIRYYIVIR
jgi:hypothetical protein